MTPEEIANNIVWKCKHNPDSLPGMIAFAIRAAVSTETLACAEIAEQVETGHYTTARTVAQVLRARVKEMKR